MRFYSDNFVESPNGRGLLRWAIMDPFFLHDFSSSWTRIQEIRAFMLCYTWVAFLATAIWLAVGLLWAFAGVTDASGLISSGKEEIWAQMDWDLRFQFYREETWLFLALGLAVGAAFGLLGGQKFDFKAGFASRLSLGFLLGIAISLGGGLALGLGYELALGITLGTALGLVFATLFDFDGNWADMMEDKTALWLKEERIIGLAFTIVLILFAGFARGWVEGLALGGVFLFWYFRIPWWVYYQFRYRLGKTTLEKHPYRKDGMVMLPLPFVDRKLLHAARENQMDGKALFIFFYQRRRFHQNLAACIFHHWQAGRLLRAPLDHEVLDVWNDLLLKYDLPFLPSLEWFNAVLAAKSAFLDWVYLRGDKSPKKATQEVLEQWQALILENESEFSYWSEAYHEPMALWEAALQQRIT